MGMTAPNAPISFSALCIYQEQSRNADISQLIPWLLKPEEANRLLYLLPCGAKQGIFIGCRAEAPFFHPLNPTLILDKHV